MEPIALPAALSVEERYALLTDPAMAAVSDPRKRRGLRYDVPFLL